MATLNQDEESWRALSIAVVIQAANFSVDGTVFDWGVAAQSLLRETLKDLVDPKLFSKRLRKPRATTKQVEVSTLIADQPTLSRRYDTIHGAKGETHEITMLFVPKSRKDRCPATTWFSSEEHNAEERRVGFVAVSRPRHALVLVVHKTTYIRLLAQAPDFVAEFEVRQIGESA